MTPAPRSRPGFTLVELLIVITIIGILLALGASATVRVIDVQRGSNTEQTVKLVSELVDRHWVAVIDKAKNEPIPDALVTFLGNPTYGINITDPEVVRVVYIKMRLRQEFPITFDEARNPVFVPPPPLPPILLPLPAYAKALQGVSPGARTSMSSVCMLLALQQSRAGITFDADRLGAGAVVEAQTDVPSIKQLIDGFGNPLAFYRWPYRNPELSPQPGHNDPTDRMGALTKRTVTENAAFRTWFLNTIKHPVLVNTTSTGPQSYKLIPVVASPGRNGLFGFQDAGVLAPPFNVGDGTMNPDARPAYQELHHDNIYSYRLRFGARGD